MKLLEKPAPGAMFQKELVAKISSRIWPIYLVNEFPKSGATWLKFMLADSLGVPAWTQGDTAWRSCVMQAHWLRPKGRCRTVALFRDGRDVMVSFYHHCFFKNEFKNQLLVKTMRDRFRFDDPNDVKANLLSFMKGIHERPMFPAFTWSDFVRGWAGRPDTVMCRYEDLSADTAGELVRLVRELTGERLDPRMAEAIASRYSMENMREQAAALNPGMTGHQKAETSFFRKGQIGGWTEVFTDDALAWFEEHHASDLTRLGYRLGRTGT